MFFINKNIGKVMGIGEEEKILKRISLLKSEHKDLDEIISKDFNDLDQLKIQRLKKRKLWIKDELSRLHDYLEPDIIA